VFKRVSKGESTLIKMAQQLFEVGHGHVANVTLDVLKKTHTQVSPQTSSQGSYFVCLDSIKKLKRQI